MHNESGFKRVARDVTDLFELQMQLFAVDSQAAIHRAVVAAVLMVSALVIALAALTTLLLSAGWGLHEWLEWPLGLSLLLVAVVALVVTAVLALIGFRSLRRALALLDEPKRELTENLRWLKATIIAPQTSARNQLRSESFGDGYPLGSDRFSQS